MKDAEGYEYTFTPVSMSGATNPPYLGVTCYGMDLREKSYEEIWEEQIQLDYLIDAYNSVKKNHPEVSFWGKADKQGRYYIDKLTGTDSVRKMIESGMSAEEIKATWQDEINAFKNQRKPYLLYEE